MKIINCNHCRSEIDRENLGEDIVCPVCGADISDLLLANIAATDQQSINTNHQSIYERHKSGVTASARRTIFALLIIILPLLSAAANGPEFIRAIKGDLFILVFPFFVTAVLLIAVAIEIIIISNQVRNYFSAALNEDFTDGDLMLMKQSNRYKRAAYGTFYRADPACPIKKPI